MIDAVDVIDEGVLFTLFECIAQISSGVRVFICPRYAIIILLILLLIKVSVTDSVRRIF